MANVDGADVVAPRNDCAEMSAVPKAHSGSGHADVHAHPNVRFLKIRTEIAVRFRPQIGHSNQAKPMSVTKELQTDNFCSNRVVSSDPFNSRETSAVYG